MVDVSDEHQVASLIAGPPGVYICNECIEICNSILQEEQRRNPEGPLARRGTAPTPPAPAGDRLLTPIELARNLDEFYQDTDSEGEVIRSFLRTWFDAHQEAVVGSKILLSRMKNPRISEDKMPKDIDGKSPAPMGIISVRQLWLEYDLS